MPKFFVLPEKVNEDRCIIDTDDVAHITKVLRLKEGDSIVVCDSNGYDYEAVISSVEKNCVVCDIVSKTKSDTEPGVFVTLYQGIPKSSKMEYIIQKNTELGISKIVPCVMARCVSKIDGEKAEQKKTERWRKIAESAAKQSGRGIVPEITAPVTFKQAVEQMKEDDIAFAPYECEEQNRIKDVLKKYKKDIKNISFIIGPEGGFDPSEAELIKNSGIDTVSLGKRILRTETAGETVTAIIMYESDNM